MHIRNSTPADAERMFAIWHDAVVATHDFLSDGDIAAIAEQVRPYLAEGEFLVAVDDDEKALGFLGATGRHVDALFVDPKMQGHGIGRALMAAVEADTVDVNEQNPGALAFYRRIGFEIAGRSPYDDQGRPFPILHLRIG